MADQCNGEMQQEPKTQREDQQAFTIRGYVAAMRERDIRKCWPFTSAHLEASLRELSHGPGYGDGEEENKDCSHHKHHRHLLPPFSPPVSNYKLNFNESFFTSEKSAKRCNRNTDNDDDDDDEARTGTLQTLDTIQVQIELLSKSSDNDNQTNYTTTIATHHHHHHHHHDEPTICLSEKKKKKILNCADNSEKTSGLHKHGYGDNHLMTSRPFHLGHHSKPTLQSRLSIREIRQSIMDRGCPYCSGSGLTDMITSNNTRESPDDHYHHDHHHVILRSSPRTSSSVMMMATNSCGSINDANCECHASTTHGFSNQDMVIIPANVEKDQILSDMPLIGQKSYIVMNNDDTSLTSTTREVADESRNCDINRTKSAHRDQCKNHRGDDQYLLADVEADNSLKGSASNECVTVTSCPDTSDHLLNAEVLHINLHENHRSPGSTKMDGKGARLDEELGETVMEKNGTYDHKLVTKEDSGISTRLGWIPKTTVELSIQDSSIRDQATSVVNSDSNGHQEVSDDKHLLGGTTISSKSNQILRTNSTTPPDQNVAMNNNNSSSNNILIQKCPICLRFQATSNTALNAHIDHCLASASPMKATEAVVSSTNDKTKAKSIQKVKSRKIKCRSIAELCAIDNNQVAALSARKSCPVNYTDPNHNHRHNDRHYSNDCEELASKAKRDVGMNKMPVTHQISDHRQKRSKAGTGRTRSSSFDRDSQLKIKENIAHCHLSRDSDSSCHDDDDDDDCDVTDDHRMMSKVRYNSRSQVQALKLLMRRQKQLKQGLTDPSTTLMKTPKISPSSTVGPITCKFKDQGKGQRVAKSITPSSRSVLSQQFRSKNTKRGIIPDPHDKETGNGKKRKKPKIHDRFHKSKRNAIESLKATGVELKKSCKKTLKNVPDNMNDKIGEPRYKNLVQGSYRQMLQAIRADAPAIDQATELSPAYPDLSAKRLKTAGNTEPAEYCCNHKDAKQSSDIQLAITEHRPCDPNINHNAEHSTVDICNIQAPVNEVNDPKSDVDCAMALEQHVGKPHSLEDEVSEVLECTASINHRSLPTISSMNIGAEVRITREMSENIGVSALTGCNASASFDSLLALDSGEARLTTSVLPLQGLDHACRDPTRNNHSSDKFTPQNLDLIQRVRSTAATLDNQRMLKSTNFPPATVAHDKSFQYATVSNQWAGKNQKNNLSLNDQEDYRTLVLVNLINPIQTNGVGHTSTPLTINHGHPTMEFIKTTAAERHSGQHPTVNETHFPNQSSSRLVFPTNHIPIQNVSQLHTSDEVVGTHQEADLGFPRSLPPWMEAAIKDTQAPSFPPGNDPHNCSTCASELRCPINTETSRTSPVFDINSKPVLRLMGKTMVLTQGGNGQNQLIDTSSGWMDNLQPNLEYINFPQKRGPQEQYCDHLGARNVNPHQLIDSQIGKRYTHPVEFACTFQSGGQSTQIIGGSSSQEVHYASKVITPQITPVIQVNARKNMYIGQGDQFPYVYSHQPAPSTSSAIYTTRTDDAYLCLQQQMLKEQSLHHHLPYSYQFSSLPSQCEAVNNQRDIGQHIHSSSQPRLDTGRASKSSVNITSVDIQGTMMNNPQTVNKGSNSSTSSTTTTNSHYPSCWLPNAEKKYYKVHQPAEVIIIDDEDINNISSISKSIPRLFGQDLNPMGITCRSQNTINGAHPSLRETLLEPGHFIQKRSVHNISTGHVMGSTIQNNPCALKPPTIMRPSRPQELSPDHCHDGHTSRGICKNFGMVINPKKRANNSMCSVQLGGRKCTMKSNKQVFLSTSVNGSGPFGHHVVQRKPNSTAPCNKKQKRKTNNGSNPIRVISNDMNDAPNYAFFNAHTISDRANSPLNSEGNLVEKCSVNMNPAEVDCQDPSLFMCTPSIINKRATQQGDCVEESRFMYNLTGPSSSLQTITKTTRNRFEFPFTWSGNANA